MWDLFNGLSRRLIVGRPAAPEPPPYAFCESRTVTGAAPWHVRALDGSGGPTRLHPHGSAMPLRTLCGAQLSPGSWDVDVPVTPRRVNASAVTHRDCAIALRARTWKQPQPDKDEPYA